MVYNISDKPELRRETEMAIFDPKTKVISGYQKTIEEKTKIIEKYYDQIGRLYYGQYKDMSVDVTKDINARCDEVMKLYKEIKDCELKILFEKGLKLCPSCNKENMLAYAFCFACGAKFPEGSDKAPAAAEIEVHRNDEASKEEDKAEDAAVEEIKTEVSAETEASEVVEEDKASEPASEATAAEEAATEEKSEEA